MSVSEWIGLLIIKIISSSPGCRYSTYRGLEAPATHSLPWVVRGCGLSLFPIRPPPLLLSLYDRSLLNSTQLARSFVTILA